MINKIFIVFFLFLTVSAFSNDLEVLQRAIDKMEYEENKFSYEATTEVVGDKNSEIKVYRFDPKYSPKYNLISIDSEIPSKKEIKKFLKEMNKNEENESETNDILGSSYTLVSKNENIIHYKYISNKGIIPGKDSTMNGDIWCDLQKEVITKIVLKNQYKINVAVGVSITNFVMEFQFIEFDENITVMSIMNMKFEGKAVVAKFSQESKSNLYNYVITK